MLTEFRHWLALKLGIGLRRAARDLDCRLSALEACPAPRARRERR